MFYLVMLTLTLGGLQLAWATEFSQGTPFLLSLGISKQVLALIWIAGPLSGTVGQPVVGILSDNCNFPIGRRKPFIIIGCILTCFSLLFISHLKTWLLWIFPLDSEKKLNKIAMPFAACGIYLLDFSIQVIQASARAFIVDCVPTHQQQVSNAWAARMIGGFNIAGFVMGSLNLKKTLPILGDSQLKVMSAVSCIFLASITTASCLYINERNPQTDEGIRVERRKHQKESGDNVRGFCSQILKSMKHLPPQIKVVCMAELFAWIGYFPMLFYTTTYVGELYMYERLGDGSLEQSTRRGSEALLAHSIVALVTVTLLPFLIKPIETEDAPNFYQKHFQKITVIDAWLFSHIVFIVCMVSTFWISTSSHAIVMFTFLGLPWGCALWAPFALISEEISRIKDIRANSLARKSRPTSSGNGPYSPRIPYELPSHEDSLDRISLLTSTTEVSKNTIHKYETVETKSGIILAIHNIFVALPQVIASLMSSILFTVFGKSHEKGTYDTSLAWVFRFGGLCCIGAVWYTSKLKTRQQLEAEDQVE